MQKQKGPLLGAALAFSVLSFGQVIQCGSPADRFFTPVAYPTSGWTLAYTDANMPAGMSLRFGPVVSYHVPVAPGLYRVDVVLIEPNKNGAGLRTETVSVDGQASEVLDIWTLAGGIDKPYDAQLVALSSAGFIDVTVTGVVGYAVVSSITVTPLVGALPQFWSFAAPLAPGSCSALGIGTQAMDVNGYWYVCAGLPTPKWWRSAAPFVSTWTP